MMCNRRSLPRATAMFSGLKTANDPATNRDLRRKTRGSLPRSEENNVPQSRSTSCRSCMTSRKHGFLISDRSTGITQQQYQQLFFPAVYANFTSSFAMAHHQERPITLGRSSASDHTLSNGNHDQDSRDDVVDGGESGKSQGQEIPVNIWDESLRSIRGKIVRQWVQTSESSTVILALLTRPALVLCVAILGILSLYWGVLFDVEKNLNSLIVYVVDFETDSSALVGPLVRQMTEEQVKTNMMPHLGYITVRIRSLIYHANRLRSHQNTSTTTLSMFARLSTTLMHGLP